MHTDVYDLTLQTGDTVRFSGSKYTWEIVKFRGNEAVLNRYGNVNYCIPCNKLLKIKT